MNKFVGEYIRRYHSIIPAIGLLIFAYIATACGGDCDDPPPDMLFWARVLNPTPGSTVLLNSNITCRGRCSLTADQIGGVVWYPDNSVAAGDSWWNAIEISFNVFVSQLGTWTQAYSCIWDYIIERETWGHFTAAQAAKPPGGGGGGGDNDHPIVLNTDNISQEDFDNYFINQVILGYNIVYDEGTAVEYNYDYFENKIEEIDINYLSTLIFLYENISPGLMDEAYNSIKDYVAFTKSEFHAYVNDLYYHAKTIVQEEGVYIHHEKNIPSDGLKDVITKQTLPDQFSLKENYPNPFNPATNISFTIPEDVDVLLEIYNIAGEKLQTLVNENRPAGIYTVTWTGTNDKGEIVPSGMYIYRLKAGNYINSKSMIFVK